MQYKCAFIQNRKLAYDGAKFVEAKEMVIKVVKSNNDCMQKVSHKICTNYSRTTFPFAALKVCITSAIVEITVLSMFFGVFTLNSYTLPYFKEFLCRMFVMLSGSQPASHKRRKQLRAIRTTVVIFSLQFVLIIASLNFLTQTAFISYLNSFVCHH